MFLDCKLIFRCVLQVPIVRLSRFFLAAFLTWCFGFSPTPMFADVQSTASQAIPFFEPLDEDTRIFVWPSRRRPYEIVGKSRLPELGEMVENYNKRYIDSFSLQEQPNFPMISIVVYDGATRDYAHEFLEKSKLTTAVKLAVVELKMNFKPCTFIRNRSRDTWAAGGVIFLDIAELSAPVQQQKCIWFGLDYLNGYPNHHEFDLNKFPDSALRRLVLLAIHRCSRDGSSNFLTKERSMDGLTPLPAPSCVTRILLDDVSKIEDHNIAGK